MKKIIKHVLICILAMMQVMVLGAPTSAPSPTPVAEELKVLYLTFDDGPSEYTEKLLELLAAHNMKATFFMLDTEMKRNPDMVKRIVDEGHAVGVHGVTHEKENFYCGTSGPLKEMEQANDTLAEITGTKTNLARTPYGSSPYLTAKQLQLLTEHNYIVWDWNIDSKDWSYRNPYKTFQATSKAVLQSQKEPKVILFHDIKYVVETMNLFIDWMEAHHYTSKPITSE